MTKLSPFDFLSNLNDGTRSPDLLAECKACPEADSQDDLSKQYTPFMVNRGLSQHEDTVLIANEMNFRSGLAKKMQYDFIRHIIRPRKRYGKWAKKEADIANVNLIMQYYGYSRRKAISVVDIFSDEDIAEMKQKLDKGGLVK